MAKRRSKNRTHVKPSPEELKKIPKSMVIRVGQTSLSSHSLNQLVKDFRNIMQPHTAIKLRERKSNKLKDFVVMCGPLGVSHLFIFTQSEKTGNVSLKIARTPQGPTITFQVQDYSLSKDIKKFLRRPKSLGKEDFLNPPLLVLNGFHIKGNEDEEAANVEKVIVSMFQNVFPPLNPSKIQLNTIKRVFMINKDAATGEISLRHYAIEVREVELSKNLKKLYKSKQKLSKPVPNLHRKDDIASLILDHDIGAYTSESEIEEDAIVKVMDKDNQHIKHLPHHASKKKTEHSTKPNGESHDDDGDIPMKDEEEQVEHQQQEEDDYQSVQQPKKKAIKLTEIGPRLTLKLVKIEEGICAGKVLHHEFVKKSDAEIRALEKRHAEKMRLKEQRRKEQEENIARKKAAKEAKKQRKLERRKARELANAKGDGSDADNSSASDSSDSEDSDSSSSENNYSDVPEDLDSDLFSDVDEGAN